MRYTRIILHVCTNIRLNLRFYLLYVKIICVAYGMRISVTMYRANASEFSHEDPVDRVSDRPDEK